MTQPIGNDFHVLSLGDQHGRMAVTKVVESERSTDGSIYSGEPEPSALVGTTDRAALWGGEDPTFRVAPPGDVLAQLADQNWGSVTLRTDDAVFGAPSMTLQEVSVMVVTTASDRPSSSNAPSEGRRSHRNGVRTFALFPRCRTQCWLVCRSHNP